jgi:hypothetical protein
MKSMKSVKINQINNNQSSNNNSNNSSIMKTTSRIFGWFLVLVLALASFGVNAQTNNSPEQTVCIGNQPYRVDETLPGTAYNWYITGGVSGTNWNINNNGNFQISVDWLVAGDYTLSIYTSLNGCNGDTSHVLVHVQPPLSVTIAPLAPLSICETTTLTFTATVVNGSGSTTYQWFVNGNLQPGANSATFVYTGVAPGADIYCEVTDPGACGTTGPATPVQSNIVHVDVSAQVTMTLTIASDVAEICPGGVVNFTATAVGSNNVAYQWFVDGVAVTGANAATFQYTSTTPGTVAITCEVISTDPCVINSPVLSNAINILVKPKPVTSPIWHN